jgi:hypothetical protein
MSDEFYMRPILFVDDVEASVGYYCDQLAFSKSYGDATFAQVERNGLEVMLGHKELEEGTTTKAVLSMSLRDPGKLGELHRQFRDCGAKIVTPPIEVQWQKGTFELRGEDLDGNLLLFWGNKPATY